MSQKCTSGGAQEEECKGYCLRMVAAAEESCTEDFVFVSCQCLDESTAGAESSVGRLLWKHAAEVPEIECCTTASGPVVNSWMPFIASCATDSPLEPTKRPGPWNKGAR